MTNRSARDSHDPVDRPVLTHTSILILTCVLVGIVFALRNQMGPVLGNLPLLFGVFGLCSWLGLGHLSLRRQLESEQRARREAVDRIEQRFDMHVARTLETTGADAA